MDWKVKKKSGSPEKWCSGVWYWTDLTAYWWGGGGAGADDDDDDEVVEEEEEEEEGVEEDIFRVFIHTITESMLLQ